MAEALFSHPSSLPIHPSPASLALMQQLSNERRRLSDSSPSSSTSSSSSSFAFGLPGDASSFSPSASPSRPDYHSHREGGAALALRDRPPNAKSRNEDEASQLTVLRRSLDAAAIDLEQLRIVVGRGTDAQRSHDERLLRLSTSLEDRAARAEEAGARQAAAFEAAIGDLGGKLGALELRLSRDAEAVSALRDCVAATVAEATRRKGGGERRPVAERAGALLMSAAQVVAHGALVLVTSLLLSADLSNAPPFPLTPAVISSLQTPGAYPYYDFHAAHLLLMTYAEGLLKILFAGFVPPQNSDVAASPSSSWPVLAAISSSTFFDHLMLFSLVSLLLHVLFESFFDPSSPSSTSSSSGRRRRLRVLLDEGVVLWSFAAVCRKVLSIGDAAAAAVLLLVFSRHGAAAAGAAGAAATRSARSESVPASSTRTRRPSALILEESGVCSVPSTSSSSSYSSSSSISSSSSPPLFSSAASSKPDKATLVRPTLPDAPPLTPCETPVRRYSSHIFDHVPPPSSASSVGALKAPSSSSLPATTSSSFSSSSSSSSAAAPAAASRPSSLSDAAPSTPSLSGSDAKSKPRRSSGKGGWGSALLSAVTSSSSSSSPARRSPGGGDTAFRTPVKFGGTASPGSLASGFPGGSALAAAASSSSSADSGPEALDQLRAVPVTNRDTGETLDLAALEAMSDQCSTFGGGSRRLEGGQVLESSQEEVVRTEFYSGQEVGGSAQSRKKSLLSNIGIPSHFKR